MNIQNISIAPWYDNKKSAVAITFDDWTPGQFHIAGPVLKEFSLVGTFFVCLSNFSMRPDYDHWKMLKELINTGNEIGNHTMTHKDMTLVSHSVRMKEIYEAQKIMSVNLDAGINTFAYPYGNCDQQTIIDVMPGHVAARKSTEKMVADDSFGAIYGYDFAKHEEDYYTVHDFCITNNISLTKIEKFIDNLNAIGGFAPFSFHGIFNDTYPGDKELSLAIDELHFRNIINILKQSNVDVWITTFKNAILYHRTRAKYCIEKRESQYYSEQLARHEYLVRPVTPDVDIGIQCSALTLTIDIEQGYQCVMVRQAEKDIDYLQRGSCVQFNIRPTTSVIAVKIAKVGQ